MPSSVRRRRRLRGAVARPPDDRPGPEDPPRHRQRQVVLPEVEHVRPGREGDVGPVVHRQQRAVPAAGGREHLEQRELLARLEALLPQLHDVDPAAENRVEERGQVTLGAPPVGAQVQPGVGQPGTQVSHPDIMPHPRPYPGPRPAAARRSRPNAGVGGRHGAGLH